MTSKQNAPIKNKALLELQYDSSKIKEEVEKAREAVQADTENPEAKQRLAALLERLEQAEAFEAELKKRQWMPAKAARLHACLVAGDVKHAQAVRRVVAKKAEAAKAAGHISTIKLENLVRSQERLQEMQDSFCEGVAEGGSWSETASKVAAQNERLIAELCRRDPSFQAAPEAVYATK